MRPPRARPGSQRVVKERRRARQPRSRLQFAQVTVRLHPPLVSLVGRRGLEPPTSASSITIQPTVSIWAARACERRDHRPRAWTFMARH